MLITQHCIECDKIAVVLAIASLYCAKCYNTERSEKPTYRVGHLVKTKVIN